MGTIVIYSTIFPKIMRPLYITVSENLILINVLGRTDLVIEKLLIMVGFVNSLIFDLYFMRRTNRVGNY